MTDTPPSPDAAAMAELELVPGTPEYDQAMVEKFEKTQQTKTDVPNEDRPGWLPEKFKSPEDLARAYEELERKQSGGKPPIALDAPDATTADPDPEARKIVTDAGVDFDALVDEFQTAGAFSAETYAALEAKGFPPSVVDAYIEGQRALADRARTEVTSIVGGDEKYGEVVQWAAQNLSPAEIDAFNGMVDSGDLDKAKFAVAGLKARYEAANGAEPSLVRAPTVSASGDVFRSTHELTTAMKDPRYAKDPVYRADVQAKLGRSNIF